MSLNFSQKNLLSGALKGKHDARTRRLQLYAFLTGIASMVISLLDLVIKILRH